jgi:hypothetical protein
MLTEDSELRQKIRSGLAGLKPGAYIQSRIIVRAGLFQQFVGVAYWDR